MSARTDMQGVEGAYDSHDTQHDAFLAPSSFATKLAELSGGGNVEQFIVDTLAQVVKAEQGSLALFDEREGYVEIQATRGYPVELVSDLQVRAGQGLMGDVLSSRAPRIIANVSEGPQAVRRRIRYRTPSCLLVPLTAAGRMLAVLNLADRADGKAFDQWDLERVRVFAAPATLALLARRLTKDKADLAKLVATDSLTGLFNRRYFEARLEEEVGRALRYGLDLTLLAVDVDLFKSVNDRFGHAAGDAVLHGVALVIRRAVRFFDVCARLGGDEFAILIHGSEASALQSADRLQKRIDGWYPDPKLALPTDVKVTVTIGLASLTPDVSGVQDLMARADRALYAAKAAGRNCVRVER